MGVLMLWLTLQVGIPGHAAKQTKALLGSEAYHAKRDGARNDLKSVPESAQCFAAEQLRRDGEQADTLVVPGQRTCKPCVALQRPGLSQCTLS